MTEDALKAIIERTLAVYRSWGPETGIEQMRRDWEGLFPPDPEIPAPEPVSAGGVPAAWIRGRKPTRQFASDRVVLYFHGGGFQLGSLRTHQGLMANLSDACGYPVLGIDYRLAPENRFPAALEDARAAYDWLREQGYEPYQIALAGDSAGGGLVVSLMLALKASGDDMPAAAIAMSPWTDMEARGESYTSRAKADPIHQRPMIEAMARAYLGRDGDPRDPLASPILGDLAGLPPLLVQVGGRETVYDDSRVLVERAKAAGVDAKLEVWEGMIHVFQMYAAELSDARMALERIGTFLRRHLERANQERATC